MKQHLRNYHCNRQSGPAFQAGTQWPFTNNGRFNFPDGLGQLRLAEAESDETPKALTSRP